MNTIYRILFIVLLLVTSVMANAQQRKNIIDDLQSVKHGQGRVMVFEDNSIKGVLGRSMAPNGTVYSGSDGGHFLKMRGFKVQAFSGNNQRTSKNEATSKQQLINQAYPEHETVVTFDSPFWRLRVGNFKSREEANEVLKQMKESFPSFGKEMYVVVDEVRIPVN